MPTHVEHRPRKDGKNWAIVEDATGHIKGRSFTKKDAKISSSYRHKK